MVDSSSWIEALRTTGSPSVRQRVRELLETGEAAWCDMVRLELWNGAAGDREKRVLREFDRDLPCLTIGGEVWQKACELSQYARSAGATAPATDLLIFVCARHHRVSLEHNDPYFDAPAGLT